MFKQNCFIRKNTPELRKKLEELGYKYSTQNGIKSNNIVVSLGCIFDIYPIDTIKRGFNNCIDCGTNEELFLALAALRDDIDKNQWFICQEDYLSFHGLKPINKGEWQLNTQYDKLTYGLKKLWRKATAEEILKNAILYV